MLRKIITGFHAVEERVLKAKNTKASGIEIFYSKPGPRVKKILSMAQEAGIPCKQTSDAELDSMTQALPEQSKDHRGIVLSILTDEKNSTINAVDFDLWLSEAKYAPEGKKITVVVLDSVTDPHNVGAIIRSCDQFGSSLVILPEKRGVKEIEQNEIIARSSAGSIAWVPVAVVSNLVRTVQQLKEAGFWIYGADAGGIHTNEIDFAEKSCVIMGSEGNGIARLLEEQCDQIVSIPTCGKIDSLNVSVAAGVLLYEIYRRTL